MKYNPILIYYHMMYLFYQKARDSFLYVRITESGLD